LLVALALFSMLECGFAQDPAPSPDTQAADELLARAMVLHKAGDLLGAIQNYQIALETAPNRPDILSNLGAAYVGLGRFAEAIVEYKKALAIQDDASIRLNLGLALYKAGRLDEAILEFRHVLSIDAQNTQAALLLADCLLQTGADQEVVDLLSPRESAFGDDLAYAYLLGTAYLRTGDTQRGERLVDRIFRKGESAEGHLLMGMAHLNKRDYQNATKELARAVEMNDALPNVQLLYGRALLGSGDREKALKVFRTAVSQHPDSFDANLQLGTLYRLDQKYDQAMVYLKRAATIRPTDVALRHGMAATNLALGDVE
jgi:tetratricopeptide (TPR) repeat protein